MDKDHWLDQVLAEVEKERFVRDPNSSFYGAAEIAARYCGFSAPPTPLVGSWQHGWKASHRRLTPQFEFGELKPMSPQKKYWVARRDQEQFLKDEGFKHSRAIGLPCVYLPDLECKRHENSLLVMPAHSLEFTHHKWKFERYAEQIDSIRDDFDDVIVCVHQSCLERGLWVNEFRRRNIPVIAVAHVSDPLTLHRLKATLSSFGFMTTNSHGSHIPYAAYWGVKVSLFGTYANMHVDDYSNTPFYQAYPHLKEPAVTAVSENVVREQFPMFFVEHPKLATKMVDWASKQLGADLRLSPRELQKEMEWGVGSRIISQTYNSAAKFAEYVLPEFAKRLIRRQISKSYREEDDFSQKLSKISLSSDDEVSTTNILGPELCFGNANSCRHQLQSIIRNEVYRFSTTNSKPIIIDGGANIGIASIYFSLNYPSAKIYAYEADPKIFELLKKNCESFQLENVDLHCRALWTENGSVNFKTSSGDAGKVVDGELAGSISVQTSRLKDLLNQQIDLLKLDVEGCELDLLRDCKDLLPNVDRIFVEYHGYFGQTQELDCLFQILKDSGFRVHLHSPSPAKHPFMHRPIKQGMDQLLEVFAFRQNGSTE